MVPVRLADRYDVEKDIHVEQRLALPNHVESVVPAVLSEEASAATLCSQLQMNSTAPIVGQTATKKQIEGNPRAHSNGGQPFVQVPFRTSSCPSCLHKKYMSHFRCPSSLSRRLRTKNAALSTSALDSKSFVKASQFAEIRTDLQCDSCFYPHLYSCSIDFFQG